MISLTSLWIPILLSAVIVFVVSSLIHMLLAYHNSDFSKVPAEDEVLEALRKANLTPGDYAMPYAGSVKVMGSPEFIEKTTRGPVLFMTVTKSGPPSMTASLIQWFIYSIVVSFMAAYITSRAVAPGAHYLEVFRFAGCTAFVGYSLALAQNSIWYKRAWKVTLKTMFDGLVYALFTAGTFGWWLSA